MQSTAADDDDDGRETRRRERQTLSCRRASASERATAKRQKNTKDCVRFAPSLATPKKSLNFFLGTFHADE
jgi:hypothetical protein